VEEVPGLSHVPPCEEAGATFEENAVAKALYYSAFAPGIVFVDDSGLEVDALGGAPGVLSARFAGPHATDEANNRLLLDRLQGAGDRAARFVCVVAAAERGTLIHTFRGVVEGVVLHQPRGSHGFGYDPLFYYPPFDCSFGELHPNRKLEVSHRGSALAQMTAFLVSREGARKT